MVSFCRGDMMLVCFCVFLISRPRCNYVAPGRRVSGILVCEEMLVDAMASFELVCIDITDELRYRKVRSRWSASTPPRSDSLTRPDLARSTGSLHHEDPTHSEQV